ncbi:hypothetical protein GCM10022403_033360 [Streptomyces coacervatus]|uniref:Uncharacterized protein n=1 Tax=Streptomyces coacervatus TaxID=647381 RepID=A0ABP7HJG8_9ACTN|nr:hypothetical protein [Streptomyces coacervatus]MDF2272335.1 hypothetical protein [Streptomyces coacervatus]
MIRLHYELGSCGQSVQQQTQGFGGADDVRLGELESPQQGEEGYGDGGDECAGGAADEVADEAAVMTTGRG